MRKQGTKKLFIILLYIFIFALTSSGQLRFKHFSTDDGLSNNSIRRIIQDKNGFLWFGTLNGLNRFDGKQIRTFTFEPGNLNSLSGNRVYWIYEDNLEYLWILTFENHLLRFNPKTEKFLNISHLINIEFKQSISVLDLYESNTGTIWAYSDDSPIFKINESKLNEEVSIQKLDLSIINENNHVNFLHSDSSRKLWIGTNHNLIYLINDSAKLIKNNLTIVSKSNNNTEFITVNEYDNEVLFGTGSKGIFTFNTNNNKLEIWHHELNIETPVNKILKNNDGEYLVSTNGQGFYYISNSETLNYSHNKNHSPDLSNSYYEIFQDKFGLYWLLSPMRGVTMFDSKKKKIKHFGLNANYRESPGDADKQTILEDSNGNLWIGLYGGGLCMFNRKKGDFDYYYYSKNNPYSLSSNFILSLFEDGSKNLWIGTFQGGLNKLELVHYNFDFIEPVKDSKFRSENEIRSLLEDRFQRLWTGTKDGHIYCYDKNGKLIFKLPENITGYRSYIKSNVYSMLEDNIGNLWIGTKGEGLICINGILASKQLKGQHFKINKYTHVSGDEKSIAHNDIFDLHLDHYGQIWIGTYHGGISIIPNPSEEIEFINYTHEPNDSNSLSDSRVRCLFQDNNNNMWIGTSYGLNFLDAKYLKQKRKKFTQFINRPEINSSLSNNDILYIHQDRKNQIWAATYGGGLNLLLNTPHSKPAKFKHYFRKDGLPSDVVFSILEDDKNNLWLGTDNGLCKFSNNGQNIERFVAKEGAGDNFFSEGTCVVASNGDFIFGLKSGMVQFNPDSIKRDQKKYPMVLTGFNLFDQRIHPGQENSILENAIEFTNEINLKHNQNFLSIEFALLDYKSPDKIQYAFILENFEEKWNYVINQNKATYRGLSPGKYVFKVKSTNNQGILEAPIELKINISPPIWRTGAAYLIYIALIILITWLIISFVTKEVRMKNEISYEKRLTEDKLMFYTNISHEFKTPLTLINSSTDDLIDSKSLSEENRKKAILIKKNSNRLFNLIEQLLDFRRIQKGKMELKARKLEIVTFLNDLYLTFLPLAEKKKIEFLFNTNIKSFEGWIDPKHVEKIVINLLSNAFKHTPEKKRILFDIGINEHNQILTINVNDQGAGISDKNINMIFDRFAFIDKDINSQFKGSGIGLSLSRDLINLHKGSIHVNSELNKGSTFSVKLPIGINSYTEEERDLSEESNLPYQILPFLIDIDDESQIEIDEINTNKTISAIKSQILIVEDNEELRKYLVEKLQKSFVVNYAINGEEGLKLAIELVPDLIISDVKMPFMDGLELTKSLRNNFNTSHIPVILLTAKSAIEHKIEGLDYGADDYITKPFNMNYLYKRIINIISQRKILKEKFSQDPGFKPEKLTVSTNDQKFLTDVIRLVEDNLKTPNYSIENIIEELGFSRTVFYKKMKSISGYAPKEFIRIVKMKKAAALLREPDMTITQVSYDIGYNDPDYFSKSFKNYFGEPPSEYQKKYK